MLRLRSLNVVVGTTLPAGINVFFAPSRCTHATVAATTALGAFKIRLGVELYFGVPNVWWLSVVVYASVLGNEHTES